MEVMENLRVVWDLSDLYCLCSALVHTGFFPQYYPQSNRELESCAMGCCKKYITVAQPLILEAYLKKTGFFSLLKITEQQGL